MLDNNVSDRPLPVTVANEHLEARVALWTGQHGPQQPIKEWQEGPVVFDEALVWPQTHKGVEQPAERLDERLGFGLHEWRRWRISGTRGAVERVAQRVVPESEHLALGLVALVAASVLQHVRLQE
eukprot:scaffold123396_cov30-Tisochrysis_lutea.AAC.12